MKKFALVLTICLVNLMAHAHPQQNDTLEVIPSGSTLTVLEDINLLPNSINFYFSPDKVISISEAGELYHSRLIGLICSVLHSQKSEDRVVRKGTTYKITNILLDGGGNIFRADLDSENINAIFCVMNQSNKFTIGALQNALKKFFRLNMATPIEVR